MLLCPKGYGSRSERGKGTIQLSVVENCKIDNKQNRKLVEETSSPMSSHEDAKLLRSTTRGTAKAEEMTKEQLVSLLIIDSVF